MNNDHEDLGRWIQEITSRSAGEQLRALQRYGDLLQRMARGELDEQAVREEYLRFTSEAAERYVRQLTTLSLSYYNALLELNRAFTDQFFNQVFGGPAERERPAPPRRRVEIELVAPLGETASASFVVENKRLETAEISFIVSEFAGPAGTSPFRPPLQIQPPRFMLGPREERVVTLSLPLVEGLFTPGERYTATVIVRGYDDLELGLLVEAEPPPPTEPEVRVRPAEEPPAEESEEEAPKPKPRRRKRKTSGGASVES